MKNVRNFRTFTVNLWGSMQANMSSGCVNNKGADHPAHQCSLISALLFTYWKVLYLNLLQGKFQFSVAEETCLSLALSETEKTGFLALRSVIKCSV